MDGEETRDFEAVYRLCAPLMGRCLRRLGCPAQDVEDVIEAVRRICAYYAK